MLLGVLDEATELLWPVVSVEEDELLGLELGGVEDRSA